MYMLVRRIAVLGPGVPVVVVMFVLQIDAKEQFTVIQDFLNVPASRDVVVFSYQLQKGSTKFKCILYLFLQTWRRILVMPSSTTVDFSQFPLYHLICKINQFNNLRKIL
jgi:hypothetical protein